MNGEEFRETETRENARRAGSGFVERARRFPAWTRPARRRACTARGLRRTRAAGREPARVRARDWDDLEGLLRLSPSAPPDGFGKRRKYALGWDAARGRPVSALLDADAEPHDVMAAALAATKAAVDSKRASERISTHEKTKTRRLEPGVAKAAYAYADARFETFEASARACGMARRLRADGNRAQVQARDAHSINKLTKRIEKQHMSRLQTSQVFKHRSRTSHATRARITFTSVVYSF